jgi:predicted GH43/DUF377 family glycosyl hydrolase
MNSSEQSLLQRYATPFRYPHYVLSPSYQEGQFDAQGVDIPCIVRHQNQFQMLHTGFDGIGYQSALAVSNDLIHWEHKGIVMGRNMAGQWDSVSTSASWILRESNGLSDLAPLKYKGKYWMVYNSYPGFGYESGSAEIGLAYCLSEDLLSWHRLSEPVFTWKNGSTWDRGGLYNTCLIRHENRFYLFYNAKNTQSPWIEQIGVAVSDDLLTFTRVGSDPVLPVSEGGFDSRFVANPHIVSIEEGWLCFYYGFDGVAAQEGLAFSEDLLHWQKMGVLLQHGTQGAIDEIHAHKPCMVRWKDTLYHFYCGVGQSHENKLGLHGQSRGICVATNVPLPQE